MFVHSGASLHRHEYSPPLEQQSSHILRRSPLARAAFSTPLTPSSPMASRPAPIIRRSERPMSDSRIHEHAVRFQAPEPDALDEADSKSMTSDGSGNTRASRYKRRAAKPSSSYHFAYPAPTQLQKQRLLHIRPKLLLQLQHLPPNSRPMPAIDVLPSTVLALRLARKFPRAFRSKGELGANDVMIVRSEAYDQDADSQRPESDSDEESFSNRELLAVICQARKDSGGSLGRAEIVLDDGSLWVATPLVNGTFEFVTVDENGIETTARWVKSKRHAGDLSDGADNSNEQDFKFSIVDPNTRRHPIMATLSSRKLSIPDYYTPISNSPGNSHRTSSVGITSDRSASSERAPVLVSERLRILIQATGIWVALRRGWCPYFKYNDAAATPASLTRFSPTSVVGRALSTSMALHGMPSPPIRSSTPEPGQSAFAAVGDKLRLSSGAIGPNAPLSPLDKPPTPQRAFSTGSAFMERAAARRSHPSILESGSETSSPQRNLKRHGSEINGSAATPPTPVKLIDPFATTPDTPTKAQRRPHSTIIPARAPPTNGKSHARRLSEDSQGRNGTSTPDLDLKSGPKTHQKLSRWRSFANLFKRGSRNSSSR